MIYAKMTSPKFCRKDKATQNETLIRYKWILAYQTESTRDFEKVCFAEFATKMHPQLGYELKLDSFKT